MKNFLLILFYLPFLAIGQNEKGVSPIPKSEIENPKSTRAVVIGISDYQEKDIPDLRFADKDAEAFANFLRSPAGGSLDKDHLQVLTNQNATAGQVAAALDWLLEQSKEGDEAIIYFSGHGDVERKTISQPGFLLCWDSPARVYMGGGTYSLAFLQEIVSTLSTQNKVKVLVVTDACHAGKLAGSQIGGSQITGASLAKQFANEVKILSCQPNEFSLEGEQWGGGRGIFSYHLVDGLFGLADRNGDGQVSVGEIDRYLEDKVTAEAAPQSQVPMLLGNKTERLATVNAAVLADLKKNKASGLPLFTATEGRGLEDDVLAKLDSGIVKRYFAFKKAVAEKRFFQPENDCAEVFYASLSTEPGLAPLHGFLKRNYAAALQDDAQQEVNTMLKTGLTPEYLLSVKAAKIYRNYPANLDRAAELLGSGHYMYPTLKARKCFFEGKVQATNKARRKSYLQALQWQADLPHALTELVVTYSAEQADSANYYATKAMEIAPTWVMPYIRLAHFYDRKSKLPEKAEAMLNQAYLVDSNSVLVWYQKAIFYDRRKEFEPAEYWYKKTVAGIAEGICFPCAHNNLGWLYFDTGRYEESEQQFKKAIQLDSTFALGYNGLGALFEVTERYAEAETILKKAIQLDTVNYILNASLGRVYLKTNRFVEAEQQLKLAIQLAEPHTSYHNSLGEVYLKTKRYGEAEQQLKMAIQLDSTYPHHYASLGIVFWKTSRQKEARQNFLKALELNPNYAPAHLGMAYLLFSENKPAEALEQVEQAILKKTTFEQLERDEDLAPLRALPAWKELMKKHFPDKVKD